METIEDDACARIARRNRTAGAGIAAFKMNVADGEADGVAFVFGEELVFPEGGDAANFERRAETLADVVDGKTGKAIETEGREIPRLSWNDGLVLVWGKPVGNGLERGGGHDGRAVGDGVVREAAWGIANDDALLEEDTKPFGGFLVSFGEREGARGDFARVGGDGEGNGGKVGGVVGADLVDEGSALAVDPFAVDGIESPGTVESESTGRGDAGFGDGHGVEGFDGMETDAGEGGSRRRRGHQESLAREQKFCELSDVTPDVN